MVSFVYVFSATTAPGRPLIGNNWTFYAALGGAVLLVLLLLLRLRRRREPVKSEIGLDENVADYPPPPEGPLRLRAYGHRTRLRLVVLAPMGKRDLPSDGAVEPMLERVLSGLGDLVRQDRPRVRTWPAQLSHQGFASQFFRMTHRPEAKGEPSRWILTAGPVRVGDAQFLLGLALQTDAPSDRGCVILQAHQWRDALRIEK